MFIGTSAFKIVDITEYHEKNDTLYTASGKRGYHTRKATAADPLAKLSEDGKLVLSDDLINDFKNALLCRRYGFRDYLMFMLQYTTGRRISDIVKLNFGDVYNVKSKLIKNSFEVYEKKTKKFKKLMIHPSAAEAIELYVIYVNESGIEFDSLTPLFMSQVKNKSDAKNVSRIGRINERSAYRIYREAAEACGITRDVCHVSTHTPRKTMGVGYYNQTGSMEGVSKFFNHSSEKITRVYCGVTDAEINNTIMNMSF